MARQSGRRYHALLRFYERRGWTDEGAFDYPAKTEAGTVLVPCHRYVRAV
jgi:hypothetical protein